MSFRITLGTATLLIVSISMFFMAVVSQAQEASPVYGVHNIELGDGVDAADFEEYVIEELVPAWKEPRNGMRIMVLKGDRGERKGKYQLIYAFDSKETRDKFFPPDTQRASELFRKTMEPVNEVMQGLGKFKIERKSYTDYSPVGVYTPAKPGSTPVIAVRDIELSNDVDEQEFEAFIQEKFAPAWKESREGMTIFFVKGDRGDRKGMYQFVWMFESIENRDEYFPEEGGDGTGKLGEVLEPIGDVMQGLQQFQFRSESYTDYYVLNRKIEK